MMTPTEIPLAALVCLLLGSLWHLYRRSVVKCAIKGLPGPSSISFWNGNMSQLFTPTGMAFHHMLLEKYGSAVKVYGLCGDEQLYVSDPRALHHILVKDQYIFEEPTGFIVQSRSVFGRGLLGTLGDEHRKQRKMLNPVFSPAHMRALVPIFYELTGQLRDVLERKIVKGETDIDILRWMSRAALEYIGVGGLGYSFQALDDSIENEYATATKLLLPTIFTLLPYRQLATFVGVACPMWLRRLLVAYFPSRRLKRVAHIVGIMHRQSVEIFMKKRHALAIGDEATVEQVGKGKDIMSILLRANMEASEKDRLPEDELLGQMNTLTFAAHDTTSSALSRILYMLSLHPERQARLRQELSEAHATHGNLDYDKLMGLPFLDAVCRETLRLHAPVTVVQRTARKDHSIPLMFPVTLTDGTKITSLPVRENQNVIVSIPGVNRSPALWGPDAAEWRPERWLQPLPESVTDARVPGVYAHLMTFIGGGRACIGFKFSELEMKVVLSVLVQTFAFAPPDGEVCWRLGSVQNPGLRGRESEPPHLPMKVSLAKA